MEVLEDKQKTIRVLLIGVDLGSSYFDAELEELGLLAEAAGLTPVARLVCKRKAPDAALYVGSGKAEEIKTLAVIHGAVEIIFDQSLSPAQQRNLERYFELPVTDRTLLILEIFAQRAISHDGKLQVELARLEYLSTRLVKRWSHLERQRGGIGARGGPGETQIELDRRMIGESIKRTREKLLKLERQRSTQRRQRERRNNLTISLVGYTNAGKSTLFNSLVKAQAYTADQLFATLDTTTRNLYLGESKRSVSLSDTVGFIRNLPHGLIDAFQATLKEVAHANLLLHVVDASNPSYVEQINQVQHVLREIGAAHIPQILVFNKLDKLSDENKPKQACDMYDVNGQLMPRIFVSAQKNEGLKELRNMLVQWSAQENVQTSQPLKYSI